MVGAFVVRTGKKNSQANAHTRELINMFLIPALYDIGNARLLVYKFKKNMGRTDFSEQFRKIIISHKCIDYNLNVMRQSACLVINPITVDNFAALFNCTPVAPT